MRLTAVLAGVLGLILGPIVSAADASRVETIPAISTANYTYDGVPSSATRTHERDGRGPPHVVVGDGRERAGDQGSSGALRHSCPGPVGVAANGAGMYRKVANTGAFAGLGERMSLRNVRNVARDAGIGLKGVKIKINRQEDLIGTGLAGHTPDANTITLYPDAFESTTTLRQTLGHERTHIYQKRTFGDTDDPVAVQQYERDTYALDYQW